MQVACGRSTGLWCLEGSLESGEDSRPCRWSLFFVNQAGDPVESCDDSSVPVKKFCLMRNSQPIYVTRWLATCCCAEGLLETLLVMLHKLRTNLWDGGSKVCGGFPSFKGGLFFIPIVELVHEEEKKLFGPIFETGIKSCWCLQVLCSSSMFSNWTCNDDPFFRGVFVFISLALK